jgi:hypothetical protein
VSTHNRVEPGIASMTVSDGFKLKDGLFEYSKNLLRDSDRDTALQWVAKHLPNVDDDLRKFMKLAPDEKARPEKT